MIRSVSLPQMEKIRILAVTQNKTTKKFVHDVLPERSIFAVILTMDSPFLDHPFFWTRKSNNPDLLSHSKQKHLKYKQLLCIVCGTDFCDILMFFRGGGGDK